MARPKILFLDGYSAAHIGNTALLDSSMENLKQQFPDAAFSALAKHPESLQAFCGCPCYQYLFPDLLRSERREGWRVLPWLAKNLMWAAVNALNLGIMHRLGLKISPMVYTVGRERRKAVKAMLDADIAVSISGEMLNDHFGRVLPFMLYGYWMARRLGKLTVIFPQSIGPLNKRWTKVLTRWVLNQCDLVMARDLPSADEAKKLGIEYHLIPDVAILQPLESEGEAGALLEKEGVRLKQRPIVGITVSEFRGGEHERQDRPYLDGVQRIAGYVTRELGGQVIFLSANLPAYGEEQDDSPVAERLYRSLDPGSQKNATFLTQVYSARQFKGIARLLDVFITTRMHAGIMATMAGTPTITLNTQRKLSGYMEMIGQQDQSIDIVDVEYDKLAAVLDRCLRDSDQIRRQLNRKREEIAPKVLQSGRRVKQLWDDRSG